MTAWRFLAQRAVSGQWLDLDLPLDVGTLTWALSGAGSLTATITPDTGRLRAGDGRLLLEPWGTFLYAEADGEIRWGGIVINSAVDDDTWSLEAAGFSTYLHGMGWDDAIEGTELAPYDVVAGIWSTVQARPDGNLGVQLRFTGAPPARLGEPARTDHIDPTPEARAEAEALKAAREQQNPAPEATKKETEGLNGTDREVEADPYSFHWRDGAKDCGSEVDALAKQARFDYVERHWWGEGMDVRHELEFTYPRAGRAREDLAFDQGVNVTEVITVTMDGDEFSNEVLGVGAGEGEAAVRANAAARDGRLRRARVYVDKGITDPDRLRALVTDELAERTSLEDITGITVRDHPHAPIGSWQLGDDITVTADLPWLGETTIRCRITGWSLLGDGTARLSLVRSDRFTHGG